MDSHEHHQKYRTSYRWKTYSVAWNNTTGFRICDSCAESLNFLEGFVIKSSNNRFVCTECAINLTPKVAEVLFLHRLHENANDEDSESYLADIERMWTELATKPPAASKETH